MICIARYCYKSSVCLSVYPSVTLRYRGHISWVLSKTITWIKLLAYGLCSWEPQLRRSSPRETPQNLGRIWQGSLFSAERPFFTLFQNTCVFGANHENLNEDRPILQQWRCSPVTLASGNIRFMRIFATVPWRAGVKRQRGCRKRQFSVLSLAISSEALEVRPTLLYSWLISPSSPFHWSHNTWR